MKKSKNNSLIFILVLAATLTIAPIQSTFADDTLQKTSDTDTSIVLEAEDEMTDISDSPVLYSAASSGGKWIKESNGRWWYRHADGSYTRYDWEYIDGNWYFFDKNGWMWTEWLQWNGDWYYLNSSGVMHTGWLKDDGKWYYFTSRGVMVERWIKINSCWYYFEPVDGNMRTEPFTYDFRTYYFYSSGELMRTDILVKEQKQEKSNWCWAASAAMVGTYYTKSTETQSSIVKAIKGSSSINEGGYPDEQAKAVSFASNNTKFCVVIDWSNITYDYMVECIDNNHPFIMNFNLNIGYGHAVVGSGYNKKDNSILVINPAHNTNIQHYKFADLMLGTKLGQVSGYCTNMLSY